MSRFGVVICACIACFTGQLHAQSFSDTASVLARVGQSYSQANHGVLAIVAYGPAQVPRQFAPRDDLRYARIMAEAGNVLLLAQKPEAPCDSTLEREQQLRRPWLQSSMLLLSLSFGGDSAVVVTGQDTGANACWEYRNSGDWTYVLRRIQAGWEIVRVDRTRWS